MVRPLSYLSRTPIKLKVDQRKNMLSLIYWILYIILEYLPILTNILIKLFINFKREMEKKLVVDEGGNKRTEILLNLN